MLDLTKQTADSNEAIRQGLNDVTKWSHQTGTASV